MTDDEACNEVEQKVLEAREGRLNSDKLLELLLDARVFLPAQDEKAPVLNVQRSARAQPLVLASEEGTPILTLFSSPSTPSLSCGTIPVSAAAYWNPSGGCRGTWAAATASCSTRTPTSVSTWSRKRRGTSSGDWPSPKSSTEAR